MGLEKQVAICVDAARKAEAAENRYEAVMKDCLPRELPVFVDYGGGFEATIFAHVIPAGTFVCVKPRDISQLSDGALQQINQRYGTIDVPICRIGESRISMEQGNG